MVINDPHIHAEVVDIFARYERALIENDVATLDMLFWRAPQTLRYGVGERLYGYEAIMAFRKARTGGSPPRTLQNTVVTTFGSDFATANTEFKRNGESRIGRQSQTWIRTEEGWRIASAHVSLEAEKS
jgi:hypothetical protein